MRDFSEIKRIVVKIGTKTLSKNQGVDSEYMQQLAGQMAKLLDDGKQVMIITSGAVGMGAGALKLDGPVTEVKVKQACAAIGQPLLMQEYRQAFSAYDVQVAQVLLTAEVLSNRKTYLNLRNSVETLLKLGVVPILNENDSVSTDEIDNAFGDNDTLSALLASKIDADLLVMLSDIDSLYDKDPRKHDEAKAVSVVHEITDEIEQSAGASGSTHATGGMKTKIEAAKIAANAGCRIVLATGRTEDIITKIIAGDDVGTVFLPKRKLSNRIRWIMHCNTVGTIKVDPGAIKAIRGHKSLLPSGIIEVEGVFSAEAVVMVNDCAKAVTNFSSEELKSLTGKHSSEIRAILGSERRDVIATPEDIVFLD
jgi:glutamate 5-kinase